jgi:hypothetical protein
LFLFWPLYHSHLNGVNSTHYVKFCRLSRGRFFFCDSSKTCCSKDTHDFDVSLKIFPCDRLSTQKTFSNFSSTTDYAAK